jgi:hypothetical protein
VRKKATFLKVPCYFDETTLEMTPRYGWINDKLLDLAGWFWSEFGWLIEPEAEGFPIVIYEEKENK